MHSEDDFVIVSNDAEKHYKVKIVEANFYVRKMILNDEVVSAIEKTLLTSPAAYPYFETLTKTFLASTGLLEIFDSNTHRSFRNFFNDEIQLVGDWRVALSEIIFPTKIEHIVNGDMVVYSLKGYEDSQKSANEANVNSPPYNGEKLSIMTGI